MKLFRVLMSMVFSGVGVRALQRTTSLSLAANEGQDAWGRQQWGPSRQATAEEGTRATSAAVAPD
jgi:hypothetical protein